eukprot:TRINITY_DN1238_c1_g1_i2.p1 TRINITY_DN1238_c1_g1~~TRINITY_DN1238_c1_g1_i2.p1  ORF type:complete len:155 (-),score=49.17 TRINITY_DN1238_c1_g1_i2:266-730(-)
MATRSARALSSAVLAAGALAVYYAGCAFLPGTPGKQQLRGQDTAAAIAVAGLAAGVPNKAEAFVYKGKEYFDVLFGIDPLYWGLLIFAILYCGATLKNALQKYYKPVGKAPAKVGKFVGKEKEVLKYGEPGAGNPEVSDGNTKPPAMKETKIWF